MRVNIDPMSDLPVERDGEQTRTTPSPGSPCIGQRLAEMALAAILVVLLFAFCQALVTAVDPALQPIATDAATDTAAAAAPAANTAIDDEQQALQAARERANALPPFLLALALLALTRRPLLSLWLTLLTVTTLYYVDDRKFDVLNAHLLPADFSLLPQIVSSPGLYMDYVRADGAGLLPATIYLGLTIAIVWLEPAQRWLRPSLRAALIALAFALLALLVTRQAPFDDWFHRDTLEFRPWEPDASIERIGLIASLVKLGGETARKVPDPDQALVQVVLDRVGEITPSAAAALSSLPDIVVWQSESLFDTGRLDSIVPDSRQPGLARTRQRAVHGDMMVPAFGGGTVRTEFEALTGLPMRAFANVSYPYSALAQKPLMALPRALRQLGYQTVAIHPYERGFWSRNTAFPNLGFDRFIDQNSFDHQADRHGIYIGDQALLRHVTTALDEAAEDQPPLFVFAISMENHGPWNGSRRLKESSFADIEVPESLSASAQREMRNYLHHLQRADQFLEQLIEFASQRERHTLVLFYGDHLPGLSESFDTLTFRDGRSAPLQPVPFVLFDNRRQQGIGLDAQLHSYHLASLLLDSLDIDVNPRFRLLSADRARSGAGTGVFGTGPLPLGDIDPEQALMNLSWHSYHEDVPASEVTGAMIDIASP